jgi:nitrogen fixation protein NifU and related proteins
MTNLEIGKKERDVGEFDFLSDHSKVFLEMAFGSQKHERVENPDGYGKQIRGCGDTVEMFITVQKDRIQWVNFHLQGCLNTNACANAVACLGEGRSLAEAWKITPQAVSDYLESLPEDHFHCAELAVGAFQRALADVRDMTRNSWKKTYRKT